MPQAQKPNTPAKTGTAAQKPSGSAALESPKPAPSKQSGAQAGTIEIPGSSGQVIPVSPWVKEQEPLPWTTEVVDEDFLRGEYGDDENAREIWIANRRALAQRNGTSAIEAPIRWWRGIKDTFSRAAAIFERDRLFDLSKVTPEQLEFEKTFSPGYGQMLEQALKNDAENIKKMQATRAAVAAGEEDVDLPKITGALSSIATALWMPFQAISEIAKVNGETARDMAINSGMDPAEADKLNTVVKLGSEIFFPGMGGVGLATKVGRGAVRSFEMALTAKAFQAEFAKAMGKNPALLQKVQDFTKVAQQVAKQTSNMLEPAQALEASMKEIRGVSQQLKDIKEPISKEAIAARERLVRESGLAETSPLNAAEIEVSPVIVKQLSDGLRPLVVENIQDFNKLIADKNVGMTDFSNFLMKFAGLTREMPEYFGVRKAAGLSVQEFSGPVKQVTDKLEDIIEFMSDITQTPITADNFFLYKSLIMQELKPIFSSKKTLHAFLEEVGAVAPQASTFRNIGDFMREYIQTNLISGLMTQVKNIVGGSNIIGVKSVEHTLGAINGRYLLGDVTRSPFNETTAWFHGLYTGALDAFKILSKEGVDALVSRAGMMTEVAGKTIKNGSLKGERYYNKVPFPLNVGADMIRVADAVVRMTSARAVHGADAVINLKTAGVPRGPEWIKGYDWLIAHPAPSTLMRGRDLGKEAVANQDFGVIAKALGGMRSALDEVTGFGGTFLIPFLSATVSLSRTVWNYTPILSIASKRTVDALRSGDPRLIADTMARIEIAHTASAAFFGLAASGVYTGDGPPTAELQKDWRDRGFKPRHIFLFGQEFNMQGFSPFVDLAALHANVYYAMQSGQLDDMTKQKFVDLMVMINMSLFKDLNFTHEWARFFTALGEGSTLSQEVQRRGASALTPMSGFLNELKRLIDPETKAIINEGVTFVERVTSRIPGLSKTLTPYPLRDGFGYPVLNPMIPSPRQWDTPLFQELTRLGVRVSPVDRWVVGDAKPKNVMTPIDYRKLGVQLSDKEFDDLSKRTGELREKYMTEVLKDPDVRPMSDDERIAEYDAARLEADEEALEELYEKYPNVERKVLQRQDEQAEGIGPDGVRRILKSWR